MLADPRLPLYLLCRKSLGPGRIPGEVGQKERGRKKDETQGGIRGGGSHVPGTSILTMGMNGRSFEWYTQLDLAGVEIHQISLSLFGELISFPRLPLPSGACL